MDRLDEALFLLGERKSETAQLTAKKDALLSAAALRCQRRKRRLPRAAFGAAACVLALAAGVFLERQGFVPRLQRSAAVIVPPTSERAYTQGQSVPPDEAAKVWTEEYLADIPLANLPQAADMAAIDFSHIPAGMELRRDDAAGLLALSGADWEKQILARPCLRYELLPEEYEGLAAGWARARVTRNGNGETGEVCWILRLNADVYFYVRAEGLSYEESLRFVQGMEGIQGQDEGRMEK